MKSFLLRFFVLLFNQANAQFYIPSGAVIKVSAPDVLIVQEL